MVKKPKNKDQEATKPGIQDKLAGRIAKGILLVQRRFAFLLNNKANQLSTGMKKIYLLLFCLVFGGFSAYILLTVFRNEKTLPRSIKPDQVSFPKHINPESEFQHKIIVSEDEMQRIQRFKKYMDSLKASESGKIRHDNLMKDRPGLMDSIQLIEQIYHQQKR